MSLVKKLKDILFEVEEDETEPIRINDDNKKEEKKKVASEPVEIKRDFRENKNIDVDLNYENNKKEEVTVKEEVNNPTSERDLFTKDNSFKFPDFDEEEFQSSIRKPKPNNNVLEFERKKNNEKRNEYRSYERLDRDNRQDDKKKFKPSPIISPVYGILNQDYKADDIVNKSDVTNIDIVRKKAFESKVEKDLPEALDISLTPDINDIVKDTVSDMPKREINDDPVVTFFDDKKMDDGYKTVNELLESASEEINLEDTLEIPKVNNLDAIEEELEKIDEEAKNDNKEDLDDTLDSDLFELIDSMYDDRKEDN